MWYHVPHCQYGRKVVYITINALRHTRVLNDVMITSSISDPMDVAVSPHLYLHGDLGPIREDCPVHLTNGGSRQWLIIKLLHQLPPILAQVFLQYTLGIHMVEFIHLTTFTVSDRSTHLQLPCRHEVSIISHSIKHLLDWVRDQRSIYQQTERERGGYLTQNMPLHTYAQYNSRIQ